MPLEECTPSCPMTAMLGWRTLSGAGLPQRRPACPVRVHECWPVLVLQQPAPWLPRSRRRRSRRQTGWVHSIACVQVAASAASTAAAATTAVAAITVAEAEATSLWSITIIEMPFRLSCDCAVSCLEAVFRSVGQPCEIPCPCVS